MSTVQLGGEHVAGTLLRSDVEYILRYFARDALRYHRWEWLRRAGRRRLVELLEVSPGEHALDVCTGTGELALLLARAGARVTAVDLSPDMLAQARKKAGAYDIHFLQADATQLPFPDQTFDVSTVYMGLHCMPGAARRAVLRELARVTRRQVVLLEPNQPDSSLARAILRWGGRMWGVPRYWDDFLADENVVAMALAAGLQLVREEPVNFGMHRILVLAPHKRTTPPAALTTGEQGVHDPR